MVAVLDHSKILVTGASGYIAAHCCHQLLERLHTVRGTVRSAEKGKYLAKLFKRYGDRFSYVVVEDLEKEGGFDEAVKGMDGVLHTASPFHYNIEDPYKDLVNPAVNGTRNLLKSVHQHGLSVRRVVVTSSFAAIIEPKPPVTVFTEEDWNNHSPAVLEKEGKNAPAIEVYRSSKVLAEKSAWEFMEAEQPKFDLVTIQPPFVLGPIIHEVTSPDKLNTSVASFYGFLHGQKKESDLPGPGGNEVDVRDVAKAHVEALMRRDAGNQRFATSNGPWTWQDVADILTTHVPKEKLAKYTFPRGTPGAGKTVKQNILKGDKAREMLEVHYHSFKDTVLHMLASIEDYEARGWKGTPHEDVLFLDAKK